MIDSNHSKGYMHENECNDLDRNSNSASRFLVLSLSPLHYINLCYQTNMFGWKLFLNNFHRIFCFYSIASVFIYLLQRVCGNSYRRKIPKYPALTHPWKCCSLDTTTIVCNRGNGIEEPLSHPELRQVTVKELWKMQKAIEVKLEQKKKLRLY